MEEIEIIARLQERLAGQVKECTDLRTLLRVLELLEGPPPQGYGVQEGVSVVEEPGVPYGYQSDLLSPAQLREVKRRYEDFLAGKGESYTWEEVKATSFSHLL